MLSAHCRKLKEPGPKQEETSLRARTANLDHAEKRKLTFFAALSLRADSECVRPHASVKLLPASWANQMPPSHTSPCPHGLPASALPARDTGTYWHLFSRSQSRI